jgi:chemotaxis family two-component system sensor kinase Cph1
MTAQAEAIQSALAICEREPIHIPGAIQAHGVLLALRSSDFTILQASENATELLGISHRDLIHQPLSRIMDIRPVELASQDLAERTPRLLNPMPLELILNGKVNRFDGILHRSGHVLILELELHVTEETGYGGFGAFYETVRGISSKIMAADSLANILNLTCMEVQKLTRFSRVMIYRFDENWNGEVIAEAIESHLPSMLKHHFPAGDIPKQARELYLTNWLRIIPDVHYVERVRCS